MFRSETGYTGTMHESVVTGAGLRARVRAIERAIARHEVLIEMTRTLAARNSRRSDLGWYASMLTLEVGTLMAVRSGKRARDMGDITRALEIELLHLQAARLLLERELQKSAGG